MKVIHITEDEALFLVFDKAKNLENLSKCAKEQIIGIMRDMQETFGLHWNGSRFTKPL